MSAWQAYRCNTAPQTATVTGITAPTGTFAVSAH